MCRHVPFRKIHILGIPFDACSGDEVINQIGECIDKRRSLTIIQPHFFHTVLAHRDLALLDLYQRYDLILPDGYGIYSAGNFLHGKKESFKGILNGTDLYDLLLRKADLEHWRIFFLGDTEEVVRALKARLSGLFPGLTVAGAHHGFIDLSDESIVPLINESKADILLVGMGTPKQDRWLWDHHHELHVPVSLTVGAAIGFISGERIRAPKAFRTVHLEWLFRLFQEPRRLASRYLIGIPKFIFYVLAQKVQQK